jgi:hypothetical protein
MDPQARERLGFGKPKLRFQIDYETAKPQKQGLFSKGEDGSFILINNDNKSFMVNDAIVKFWDSWMVQNHHSISRSLLRKLGLPRQQIEQEILQLLEQLYDAELIKV